MAENFQLATEARDTFGKGTARKLRAAGRTPVVVYGHGTDPQHLSVETHPLSLIVRYANSLIELDIAGKSQLVLVKDVQKDPVRQIIEHVDLVIVRQGETVEVEVPLHIVGEPFSGMSVLQELNTIRVNVPAIAIPEAVEVDITGRQDGFRIVAADVVLPAGASLLDDPQHLVVHIVAPRGAAAEETEEA